MKTLSSLYVNTVAGILLSVLALHEATASTLSYSGQNPAIFSGANPSNASVLLAGVNRPKDPKQS